MMKIFKKTILLFLPVIMLAPVVRATGQTTAKNEQNEIKNLLVQRDNEIKDLIGPEGSKYTDQQKNKLKKIINDIVDYNAMAKVALQKTYDTLSVSQRKEFVNVFSQIIRDQSLNKLDIYRANVDYKNIAVNNDTAYVKTIATLKDVRTPVAYRMKKENGNWFITDMIIDNVSTAESYKRSFQSYLRKKSYNSLLATLKKRAAR
ncbi:MAG TPA: ABC transporter substrate-binding protein [Balneolales bacterium]|nr:ABC transporter substrate-binding protein [Balneolales bacterium]